MLTSGMVLATEKDYRIDRLVIHGTKGSIQSEVEYNQAGECTYKVWVEGKETVKTVSVPQNYSLEVAQLGRCILGEETPYITREFSLANSKVLEQILNKIGY